MDSVGWFSTYDKETDPNSGEKHSRPPDTLHNNTVEHLDSSTPPPEQKPKLFINKSIKDDPDEVICLIDEEEEEEAVENYRTETREALQHLLGLESESEYKFIEAIERYRDILESQVELFSGKHLKEAVTKDLLFITTNYKRIAIMYIDKYLDVMSEILVFVCDVIRNFFVNHKYLNMKIVKRESRRIKMLLRDCMLNKVDRIMHILLRVRVATDIAEHQVLWAGIFRYFLARVSTYTNKDDIVRGFIIFQRLREARPEKEAPTIESYMYTVFKKSKRDLRRIPILNEMLDKIENDPLYSVRDMCVHYNRHYKKKQKGNLFDHEEAQKDEVKTDVFDGNWKPRLDLTQMFFSPSANPRSRFAQILAERKPGQKRAFIESDGLWGSSSRMGSNDSGLFGDSHVKFESSKSKAGSTSRNTPIVILDDDSDDDAVIIVSEDIKTITVPSDSDNSTSFLPEDVKTVRVGETVEASAQTEENQGSVKVIAEKPVENKPTDQEQPIDLDSINSATLSLTEDLDKPTETAESSVKDQDASQNEQLSVSGDDAIPETVDVPSTNEPTEKVVDDITEETSSKDNVEIDTALPADDLSAEGNEKLSDERAQSTETQTQIEEDITREEVGDTSKTLEGNPHSVPPVEEIDVETNNNIKKNAVVEETTAKLSEQDDSSSNKPQDESLVESPVQAECDTTDNNPTENGSVPDRQIPSSTNSFSSELKDIDLEKAKKTYIEQLELDSNRLESNDPENIEKSVRDSNTTENKSEKQLECDSTVERFSDANSGDESLGCDGDDGSNFEKPSHDEKTPAESSAALKETSDDVNHEKPSSKLTEYFQSFNVEETDALPLSDVASVDTAKDDDVLSLKQDDQQVILFAKSPTMLSVTDSLIIDEGSAQESTSALSDLNEALLSLDQMKISSGDGESPLTVSSHACIDCPSEVLTLPPLSSSASQDGNSFESGNNSLKVRLPLVHCAEALEKLPSVTAPKKVSKQGKSLKRRRSSSTKASDHDNWPQSKRTTDYLSFQTNTDDPLSQHTALFNYGMEGPLQKPVANGKNSIDAWSWNEEESHWNDGTFPDLDSNNTRISVIPDTQLCQTKKTIYPKTSDLATSTSTKPKKSGKNRVDFQLPEFAEEIQNELPQEEPSNYLNYNLNNLFLSTTNSNIANVNSDLYSHLTYHNSNSSYYDASHHQNKLYSSQETAEINPNLLHNEKNAKNEEFGAISRTLNDVNAVLDQGSIFVASNSEDINLNNAISGVSDRTGDVLLKDGLLDGSLASDLTVADENAYFSHIIDPIGKKSDASGAPVGYDAPKIRYDTAQESDQSYFESGQGYSIPYYQSITTPHQELQTVTSGVLNLPSTSQSASYYQGGAIASQNSQLPLIPPPNAFYTNPLVRSKASKPSPKLEGDPRPMANPYYSQSLPDSKKTSSSKPACSKSHALSSSKVPKTPKLEEDTFKSSLFYSSPLEEFDQSLIPQKTSTYVSSTSSKAPKLEGGALKSQLGAGDASKVFLSSQPKENAPVFLNSTISTAPKLEEDILKSQLLPGQSAATYYPSPVPTLSQITQNAAPLSPQSFLTSNAVKVPSKIEEVKTQLPPKKRKLTDEEDMSLYLAALSGQKKLEENISYPAKRQMSIADLQRDFPKIKTLAARKLYPDGTFPDQSYYCPEGYGQYNDYNKRSVMNVYINGLRECSANYPLCLMIGTVHTCMNNQNAENGQYPEQTNSDPAPAYEAIQPAQPLQNLPKATPTDMTQRPMTDQRVKRSRKGAGLDGLQPPKRGRGRPRKNVN